MADRYPIEQFLELKLPGFNSEATLWDIAHAPTDWQTVLSLSIYSLRPDGSGELDVLTAIRTDDTETHPHVISTPTGRFPQPFQAPLLVSRKEVFKKIEAGESSPARARDLSHKPGHFRLGPVGPEENQVVATFAPKLTELPDRQDTLAYLAQDILARKLGLGEALQKTEGCSAIGTISLSEVIAGFSYAADKKETDQPLWEPLLMYAAVIMLNDRNLLPKQTKAYRKIGWTSVDNFLEGQKSKQSELLIPDIEAADEASVCIRGLCLRSTWIVSNGANLRGHLGLSTL